jgi:fibronectin type 3 domain-containing protein
VAGYNVYPSTQSGSPYATTTSTLDASTIHTDSTVQAGLTYYYVVTEVDTIDQSEGMYSNQAQAVIP